MTATLIDGAAIAAQVYDQLKLRVAALSDRGVRPGLAAIIIGRDPASEIYLRNKTRACGDAGVHSELHRFDADCAENEVMELIGRLNADANIHGILVQMPLPLQFNSERILHAIDPAKDVDGFSWENLGALVAGQPRLCPCTPLGIMAMLDSTGVVLDGIEAVVIGRSVTVGKPMALMLIARGATVTVCNSKTRNLQDHTSRADLLVVAVGKAGVVNGGMLKPGAIVIDVGINRLPDGKLAGDVDFASASRVASRITPVPGGVGRMTVAMLISNTVAAAEHTLSRAGSAAGQR